jgi:uncharacterized UPF0160 family protein
MLQRERQARTFGTHSGTFHADEVTACALLILTDRIDLDRIVRSRDPERLATCEYVADVGGMYDPSNKRFDHHQVDYTGDRASAGLILDYLEEQGDLSPAIAAYLRDHLVWGIDAVDTGRLHPVYGVCSFSQVIANFNPVLYETLPAEQDSSFHQALQFTLGHLQRMVDRFEESEKAGDIVVQSMRRHEPALLFDRPVPWQDAFFQHGGETHPALFVVMPSGPHWKLRAIPPTASDRMGVRQPLPKAWAGLLDEELERASGIKGAVFCHKGRFISVWETREAVMEALERALGSKP